MLRNSKKLEEETVKKTEEKQGKGKNNGKKRRKMTENVKEKNDVIEHQGQGFVIVKLSYEEVRERV